MDQAVSAGGQFYKDAEVGDAHNATRIDLADGWDLRQAADDLLSPTGALPVGGSDVDGAVVLNVHFDIAFILDGPDGLATGADDCAQFVRVHVQDEHARGVGGEFRAGRRNGLAQDVQNLQAGLAGLLQGLGHNPVGDALDLDVHLQGGDPLLRPGDLEVHIAQVVLHPQDVGQDAVAVPLLDQSHRDARDVGLDGHPGIHERQGGAADGGHRGGAVGREDLADDADGIRELVLRRDDGQERPLRQRAVADLPPPRTPQRAGLAGAVGREVVVVHVPLRLLGGEVVQQLLLPGGAQRRHGEDLGLATGEEAGAVGAGQEPHLRGEGPDGVRVSPIHAHAVFQNAPPDHLPHNFLKRLPDQQRFGRLPELLLQFVHQAVDGSVASRLIRRVVEGGEQTVADVLPHLGDQWPRDGVGDVVALGLAHRLPHLLLDGDYVLDGLMAQPERLQDDLFGHLVGAGLHHQDGLGGPCQPQVQETALHLRDGGVDHQSAVYVADARGADRPSEGDVGNRQSGRGGDDGEDVRLMLLVLREGRDDNLYLMPHVLGEQRAQGTVGQAGDEDGALGGAALPALEGAGNAAGRVESLLKVHRQREEIYPFPLLGGHSSGSQQDGVTAADGDGATGLQGQMARLQGEGMVPQPGYEGATFHYLLHARSPHGG